MHPQLKGVILSVRANEEYVHQAPSAGAAGYLRKAPRQVNSLCARDSRVANAKLSAIR